MRKPPFLIGVLCCLLVLQASYYFFLAWVFTDMFRVLPGQPLPRAVWSHAADAIVLLLLCGLLLFDLFRARKWFIVPAVWMLCYGTWWVAITQRYLAHWSGILEGDFFRWRSPAAHASLPSVSLNWREGAVLFSSGDAPLKEHA
jgi:hypothetical protein